MIDAVEYTSRRQLPMHDRIPTAFLSHAATVLTDNLLTGQKLVDITSAYAADFNVDIPHAKYPFLAPNKRTALLENLIKFEPMQQYQVIRELCDRLTPDGNNLKLVSLKVKLLSEYSDFADEDHAESLSNTMVVEKRHWLSIYPEVRKLYDEALQKHDHGVFRRNTLDDLRLALEKLLRKIFGNSKSIENQIPHIGKIFREKGGSPQLVNMFENLVDNYTK